MQIHVVRQGENINTIAQAFNTSPGRIISTNELDKPNELVVGQALVIPIKGSYYWVQSGDTLYTISRRFGQTAGQLAKANNISVNSPLKIRKAV